MTVLPEHLDRAGQELHPNALALGLAKLLFVDDEFRARAPVDDRDVFRTVTEARARAVHGRVATADHDHVVAHGELLAEVGDLHEVDAVLHPVELVAGDVEDDRVHRARRDRDRIEVALELIEGDVHADRRVVDERDPEALDEADVHLDRLARQTERGNADEHRAPGVWQRIEDGDRFVLLADRAIGL